MSTLIGSAWRYLFQRNSACCGDGGVIGDPLEYNGLRAVCLEHWPGDPQLLGCWDELSRGIPGATVFHCPGWQQGVWRHLPRRGRLRLITVCRGAKLLAVLPLRTNSSRALEPPAPNITDYLDPLIAPEAQSDCWRIILKLLSNLGNGSTPVLALHNVRDQASLCDVLPPIASQEGFSFEKTFCENAPRIRLPGTFEQWLGTLDAHHRKEVRRKLNKALAKGNADLQICPVDQIAATLDRFIVLMQRRGGQKAQDVRRVLGPILRLAAPALIRQGRIRISTLLIHAHPAASLLDMPTPDGPMLYNTGFDPSLGQWSPGVVAIVLSIRAAIASGASVYDLLRGDEPYKYRLGAVNCPLWRITLRRR